MSPNLGGVSSRLPSDIPRYPRMGCQRCLPTSPNFDGLPLGLYAVPGAWLARMLPGLNIVPKPASYSVCGRQPEHKACSLAFPAVFKRGGPFEPPHYVANDTETQARTGLALGAEKRYMSSDME